MQEQRCAYCGRTFDTTVEALKPTVDHVYPLIRGGDDQMDNIVAACYECNQSKGDRLYIFEWTPA